MASTADIGRLSVVLFPCFRIEIPCYGRFEIAVWWAFSIVAYRKYRRLFKGVWTSLRRAAALPIEFPCYAGRRL